MSVEGIPSKYSTTTTTLLIEIHSVDNDEGIASVEGKNFFNKVFAFQLKFLLYLFFINLKTLRLKFIARKLRLPWRYNFQSIVATELFWYSKRLGIGIEDNFYVASNSKLYILNYAGLICSKMFTPILGLIF